jgi:hypothetical protein
MLSLLFPYSALIEAQGRVGKIYDRRIDKVDMSSKVGYMREIDEFQGIGSLTGLIDRVISLFNQKLIAEKEVKAVIEKWEELWYGVLGYKHDRK